MPSHKDDDEEVDGELSKQRQAKQQAETIRVHLDESTSTFLSKAVRQSKLFELAANCRQAISSLRLFSPLDAEAARSKRDEWTDEVSFRLPVCRLATQLNTNFFVARAE